MRLKLYRARSVAEAMALVRAELGADALILTTRRLGQGVELTAALEDADEPPPLLPPPCPPAGAAPLAWHGLPPALAGRLGEGDLAGALSGLLRFGTLPLGPEAPPLLLAGPPGAGKTLTVARLATRLVMAGQTPLVITADGSRAGAAEQLAAYTRLLGIGLVVASKPATLGRALHQRTPGTPVLIDTAGINPFDATQLEALCALAQAARASVAQVLPAGQDASEAAEQAACFAQAGARHIVATRLDLARRLGSVVTAAVAGNLILTEAGIGPGAADGLTSLTPAFLAARLQLAPGRGTPATSEATRTPHMTEAAT